MAVQPKPNKRDAILNAMLDVIVERGFHDAPMSLISKRSGASTGIIYHYFSSKDEIIHALYERVRALEISSILQGYSPEMKDKEAFLQGWSNIDSFYRKHQREMRFLEQYKSAGFVCQANEESPELSSFTRRFSSRSKGGVLVDVRDVADLHLRAMTYPAAKGERFLAVAGDAISFLDAALILKRRMGAAARRVPTRELPDWLIRFGALFIPDFRLILYELGKVKNATNEKAPHMLGWQPRSNEECIVATAESLLSLGLLKHSPKAARG